MQTTHVRVRFAPSPTGYFHVGGLRTALFNWLFARRHHGQFILRIEDTDRTRYNPAAIPDLLSSLSWLGLNWDEGPDVGGAYGPYYQSDRLELYRQYAEQLVAEGKAYRCYCSPERLEGLRKGQPGGEHSTGYDRHCRHLTAAQKAEYQAQGVQPVIRFAMPLEGVTVAEDLLRGQVTFENAQQDDLVLLKSDGFPTYHLAVVVDDHLMQISHILRGEEWLSSTPKHVQLYRAFDWPMPVMVHLPTILDPSGHGKMSKRKKQAPDGSEYLTLVHEFREAGYLPEAMVNFIALVGWSPDDKTEFMERADLVRLFDLSKVSKAAAAFSYDKLNHMNAAYIRSLGANDLAGRLQRVLLAAGYQVDFMTMLAWVPLVRERLETLEDIEELIGFSLQPIEYAAEQLIAEKLDRETAGRVLASAIEVLQRTEFEEAALEAALRSEVERLAIKARQYFGCLRTAITGKSVSPPLVGCLVVMGRAPVLERLQQAQDKLAAL
ncbi:MAG: glutamate--tRNA ligase [Chloroflexi bacterium]|nr:glutamate--tRNA ligase [Chloroflexota bacterium]